MPSWEMPSTTPWTRAECLSLLSHKDSSKWPKQLLSLDAGQVLKNDEDFVKYPWGKPAYALQATLAKAPGYNKDAGFTPEANTALRRLESWFFKLSKPAANALSMDTVESWAIPAKLRDPIIDMLRGLNADTFSQRQLHPKPKC